MYLMMPSSVEAMPINSEPWMPPTSGEVRPYGSRMPMNVLRSGASDFRRAMMCSAFGWFG
jgi:hypothetical protein